MQKIRWKIVVPTMLLLSGFLSGCMGTNNRVIYVKDGSPVRLAQPVKAKVWIKDAKGEWAKSDNEIEIPEGWYALSDPGK